MKKILFLLLILLPIANAQDITVSVPRDNYYQYETLQAEININLTLVDKITVSNFALLDKKNNTIPVPIFLEEISNKNYFIYFNIPELDNGTYYFLIKDVRYLEGILKKNSVYKEFYLSNIKSISIYPAIFNHINSTNLQITNHGSPINISLKAGEIGLDESVLLNNVFNFQIDIPKNMNDFDIRLDYGDRFYLIPAIPYKEPPGEIPQKPSESSITLLNSTFGNYFEGKFYLTKNSTLKGPFYIRNNLDSQVNNIIFSLTGDLNDVVKLNTTLIPSMQPGEIIIQYIWLNEKQNPTKEKYSGNIEVKYNNELLESIPLEITFFTNEEILKNFTKEIAVNKTETPVTEKEDKKQSLVIIFVVLVVVIAAVLLYFIFKKQKPKDIEEFLKNSR